MNHDNRKYGFTIVELMLAMGFVSALLLAIAMTVLQIGDIYNRSITYKNVNQAGSSITTELQRSINSSNPFDISTDINGNGTHYVVKDHGGRLCTDKYSYIWNLGSAVGFLPNNRNRYIGLNDEIRFVKVIDSNSNYCLNPNSSINSTDSVELLKAGQYNLAIHKFTITTDPSADNTNTHQRLYSIEFTLGTNNQTTLNSDQTACLLANDLNSDPTYCSINRFNFVARAGNTNILDN